MLPRELLEEAGVDLLEAGTLLGVLEPGATWRFHAVTVVVGAKVSDIKRPPMNALEIREVKAFADDQLPSPLSHGMTDVLAVALEGHDVLGMNQPPLRGVRGSG